MLTLTLLLMLAAFVATIYASTETRTRYLWIAVPLLVMVEVLRVVPR